MWYLADAVLSSVLRRCSCQCLTYATGANGIEWYEYVISVLIMIVAVFTAITSVKRFQYLRKHINI